MILWLPRAEQQLLTQMSPKVFRAVKAFLTRMNLILILMFLKESQTVKVSPTRQNLILFLTFPILSQMSLKVSLAVQMFLTRMNLIPTPRCLILSPRCLILSPRCLILSPKLLKVPQAVQVLLTRMRLILPRKMSLILIPMIRMMTQKKLPYLPDLILQL
jgi:hypothetical protein